MSKKRTKFISEWKPLSELKILSKNNFNLESNIKYSGRHNIPFEVKAEGDQILWRLNNNLNYLYVEEPKKFITQFGTFNNYNNGEFNSWLGVNDFPDISEASNEKCSYPNYEDYLIEGNFCDMFDLGEYSYAISNLLHMMIGHLKIIRINKNIDMLILYDNYNHSKLRYLGRWVNDKGIVLIASGYRLFPKPNNSYECHDITMLFQIDELGTCKILKRWNFDLPNVNSIVKVRDYIYVGQNEMITRVNLKDGDRNFYKKNHI